MTLLGFPLTSAVIWLLDTKSSAADTDTTFLVELAKRRGKGRLLKVMMGLESGEVDFKAEEVREAKEHFRKCLETDDLARVSFAQL